MTTLWRAVVERVQGNYVYVRIPRKHRTQVYGPLIALEGVFTAGLTTTVDQTTQTDGDPPHTHGLVKDINPLAKGDRVIVGTLEGAVHEFVVLGRYRP